MNKNKKLERVSDSFPYKNHPNLHTIDFFDLWNTIWFYKKIIILILLISVIISSIVAFQLPKQYKATTTFLQITESSKYGNMLGLAAMAGIDLNTEKRRIDHILLMNSRSFIENVILKLNLIPLIFGEEYDPKTKKLILKNSFTFNSFVKKLLFFSQKEVSSETVDENEQFRFLLTKATQILQSKVEINKNNKTSLVSVVVIWNDRNLAVKIANSYIKELKNYLSINTLTVAKKSRVFIESQVISVEKRMKLAEEKLQIFSKKHGIFKIGDQASILSAAIGQIKGQISLETVNLQVLEEFQGNESTQVSLSKAKLVALQDQLEKLEKGSIRRDEKKEKRKILSLHDLNILSIEYGRLNRELIIQQEIYKMLRTQFETAKIEEVKETDSIQIIDEAIPLQLPFKPKKLIIIVSTGIISLFVSIFLVFLFEFVKNKKKMSPIKSDQ
jgi:uncharacterized protein involved in exopolysaccharide biosynthesis